MGQRKNARIRQRACLVLSLASSVATDQPLFSVKNIDSIAIAANEQSAIGQFQQTPHIGVAQSSWPFRAVPQDPQHGVVGIRALHAPTKGSHP